MLLKAKLFRKLYYTFVKSGLCSFYLQRIDLLSIILNVKDYKHTLIYLKNVKSIYSVFYKNTLSISYNNDYIKKHSYLIVITKNIYKLPLKNE